MAGIRIPNNGKHIGSQKRPTHNDLEKLEPTEGPDEKGCVYFIRNIEANQDLYKIGETQNLLEHFKKVKPKEILNVIRCSNRHELAKELHDCFKDCFIPQVNCFRFTSNQIESVHMIIRAKAQF